MFMIGYSNNGFIGQAFHIHARYKGDWDELVLRDYLIQHSKIAQESEKLKLRLSSEYNNDREKYTNNKTEFFTRITKTARKQLKN